MWFAPLLFFPLLSLGALNEPTLVPLPNSDPEEPRAAVLEQAPTGPSNKLRQVLEKDWVLNGVRPFFDTLSGEDIPLLGRAFAAGMGQRESRDQIWRSYIGDILSANFVFKRLLLPEAANLGQDEYDEREPVEPEEDITGVLADALMDILFRRGPDGRMIPIRSPIGVPREPLTRELPIHRGLTVGDLVVAYGRVFPDEYVWTVRCGALSETAYRNWANKDSVREFLGKDHFRAQDSAAGAGAVLESECTRREAETDGKLEVIVRAHKKMGLAAFVDHLRSTSTHKRLDRYVKFLRDLRMLSGNFDPSLTPPLQWNLSRWFFYDEMQARIRRFDWRDDNKGVEQHPISVAASCVLFSMGLRVFPSSGFMTASGSQWVTMGIGQKPFASADEFVELVRMLTEVSLSDGPSDGRVEEEGNPTSLSSITQEVRLRPEWQSELMELFNAAEDGADVEAPHEEESSDHIIYYSGSLTLDEYKDEVFFFLSGNGKHTGRHLYVSFKPSKMSSGADWTYKTSAGELRRRN